MNQHHAHQLLRASDPRMAALIARSRRYEIGPAVSIRPFDALAESIAYQQPASVRCIPKENGSIPQKFSPRRTKRFALQGFRARRSPRLRISLRKQSTAPCRPGTRFFG